METTRNPQATTERPVGDRRGTAPRGRLPSLALALALMAGALSGCATLAVEEAIGRAPVGMREEVVRYDWAGRRGDEMVLAYTVRGDRTEEPRWVSLDLRHVVWTRLGAGPVGVLHAAPAPVPDPASMDPVPVVSLAVGAVGSSARGPAAMMPSHPLAVQARAGRQPVLTLVASDPTSPGGVRVTTWEIALGRAPARPEPLGRALSRAFLAPAALAVDIVTAPLQLLLISVLGMH